MSNEFTTPANIKRRARIPAETPDSSSSPAVHLPATPFLKKLGYGTGVSVFLYQRSPANEKFRSPWAVKKVNKRHALSQFGKRLEEEAEILKKLSHSNIIGYRAFNKKSDGTHALVMEDGHKSLFDIIEEGRFYVCLLKDMLFIKTLCLDIIIHPNAIHHTMFKVYSGTS